MEIDASQTTTIINQGLNWWKSAALASLLIATGLGGWWMGQISPEDERPLESSTKAVDTDTHLRLRIADPD